MYLYVCMYVCMYVRLSATMSVCPPACLKACMCLYDGQTEGRTCTYGWTDELIRQLDTQKEHYLVSQLARWTDSQTKSMYR